MFNVLNDIYHSKTMRLIMMSFSLIALVFSTMEPALAGREGVPGRRMGGGTRLTPTASKQVSAYNFVETTFQFNLGS